jgi:CheY-like chemotaxis protein
VLHSGYPVKAQMSELLPTSRPETIVIVDDQPVVLEFCRTVLERAGYSVFAASGGAQALNFFEPNRSPIDLALVDLVMPGMSGIEFVSKLEQMNLGTRIVLMSGYAPDEVKRVIGSEAAQYRCMWKPFEAATLVQMIKNALDTPAEARPMVSRANV